MLTVRYRVVEVLYQQAQGWRAFQVIFEVPDRTGKPVVKGFRNDRSVFKLGFDRWYLGEVAIEFDLETIKLDDIEGLKDQKGQQRLSGILIQTVQAYELERSYERTLAVRLLDLYARDHTKSRAVGPWDRAPASRCPIKVRVHSKRE